MKPQRKWLFIPVVLAAIVIAIASGVSPSTLAFVGLTLLCPTIMFFSMRGMGVNHGYCHSEDKNQSEPEYKAGTESTRKAA